MPRYRHPAMKQLAAQQVRYAPKERKAEQLDRAERLLAEIQPRKKYSYQFVCGRITDYRTDLYPDLVLDADDLLHDLPLFIDDVSSSVEMRTSEVGEPVLSIEDISRRYSISAKTVNRWRRRGLVARRFVVDGRRRLGFLQSSVERFVREHQREVLRGSRFSQLTDEERHEILDSARRLASAPSVTLSEVSRTIARQVGRSPETIRYTIKNFDRDHPEQAIFPTLRGALDHETKQSIYNAFRRGMSVDGIARQYHRKPSSVYRIINEIRAERILSRPIEYMYHPSFDAPDADDEILVLEPEGTGAAATVRPPAGLPPYLQSLYQIPLLTREQEQHLFRKMNYRFHKAKVLADKLNGRHIKASDIDRIEALLDDALEIKRRLVRANLRLVVSIAKKHAGAADNLFELISDGNISLMRAVEKFDYSRGFKFSTYASWAIMKNFARSIPAENKRRDRFVTGQEIAFDLTPDRRTDEYESELAQRQMRSAIERILDRLEERERKIIICRYGLGDRSAPQTLEEVGSRFGVTKERIRQIEARAINKLRKFASEEKLDLAFLN